LFTPTSVAWAESSTAISSWNGVSYSSSVRGAGLAAWSRAKIWARLAAFMVGSWESRF